LSRNHSLYKAVSNYTSLEGKSIGFGLFTASGIKKKEIIGYYFGSVVSNDVFQERRAIGLGGYGVRMSEDNVKDCRQSYLEGVCIISAANSVVNLKNAETGIPISRRKSANATLIVRYGKAYLRATRDISAHEEILTCYSSSYTF